MPDSTDIIVDVTPAEATSRSKTPDGEFGGRYFADVELGIPLVHELLNQGFNGNALLPSFRDQPSLRFWLEVKHRSSILG
jgi:hypothetical protein